MEETLEDLKFPSLPESEPSSPSSPEPSAMPDLDWRLQRMHDVALIYAKEDDDEAFRIMEEMSEGTGLDVRLQTDEKCFGANIVEIPAEIASKCWLVLVVHTHHTTDCMITSFIKDDLIGLIRLEQCDDYIRPLSTDPGLPPLSGLAAIESLSWDSQCEGTRTRTMERIQKIIEYQKEKDRTRKVENLKIKAPVKYCDEKFKRQFSNDSVYKMNGSRKGLMIIINNYVFKDSQKYPRRDSSCKDAESLYTLFTKFGFEVQTETNLTAKDIRDKFLQYSKAFDQKDYCCSAAAILSHGKNGGVLGTDGIFVSFTEIKDIFLGDLWIPHSDKPKLFFIQACQEGATSKEEPTVTPGPFALEAHFYWAVATVPGYPAGRDEDDGSYFIKCLVDVFAKYAREYDLGRLMDKVAYDVGRITYAGRDVSPQVPEKRSTLEKQLYFSPGI
ncbi:caspase-3-like [Haliotis asinina]|uniref:caspase-3-like n=1 Tax=Haliotis asinina TaxID=109174 RepID=UPI003531DD2F